MSWLAAVLLGLVQGLTEFLPVSSSGHLALAQSLLPGFAQPGLVFDLALHGGTMLSVLVLEWPRLLESVRGGTLGRLVLLLTVGTAATAAVAFPLRGWAEAAFAKPFWVGWGFLLTALLLLLSRRCQPHGEELPRVWQALLIGLAQGVAVFPGLSRSGTTIAVALVVGMGRRWAADFSFLLSLPAIGGALLVELWSQRQALVAQVPLFWLQAGVGALVAAAAGFAALLLVRRLVREGKLAVFVPYLVGLGLLVLVAASTGRWA